MAALLLRACSPIELPMAFAIEGDVHALWLSLWETLRCRLGLDLQNRRGLVAAHALHPFSPCPVPTSKWGKPRKAARRE